MRIMCPRCGNPTYIEQGLGKECWRRCLICGWERFTGTDQPLQAMGRRVKSRPWQRKKSGT